MAPTNGQFKEYISKSGGEKALCDVLIKLDSMKNKPENPVEYVRDNISPEMTELFKTLKEEAKNSEEELSAIANKYPKIYEKYLKRKEKLKSKKGRKAKKK